MSCFAVTEIVIALRLHGPTDIAMCEKGVKAIRTLGTDAVTKHFLRDAGACEGTFSLYSLSLSFFSRCLCLCLS